MKAPRIGQLHHRVAILTWRDTPTGDAATTPEFTRAAACWARIEPVGEIILHGSVNAGEAITHRVFMRRRTDLTVRHVIEYEGQRYRIRRITDLSGERRFTVASVELWGDVADATHTAPDAAFWS
mgnify:CR=1 FL=1